MGLETTRKGSLYYFVVVGGFKAKDLPENLEMDCVEFLKHTVCENKRFSRIQKDGLDDLTIYCKSPFTPESVVFEKGSKEFTCLERLGGSFFKHLGWYGPMA